MGLPPPLGEGLARSVQWTSTVSARRMAHPVMGSFALPNVLVGPLRSCRAHSGGLPNGHRGDPIPLRPAPDDTEGGMTKMGGW